MCSSDLSEAAVAVVTLPLRKLRREMELVMVMPFLFVGRKKTRAAHPQEHTSEDSILGRGYKSNFLVTTGNRYSRSTARKRY